MICMFEAIEYKMARKTPRDHSAWSPPEVYDLNNDADRTILDRKLDTDDISYVVDGIELIASDLDSLNNPQFTKEDTTLQNDCKELINLDSRYGNWFYFPWMKALIHYPPQEDHLRLRTARNRNLITESEQKTLYAAALAIFGLSVGSNIAIELVSSGIGNKFIIADPDKISPTNLNRMKASFNDVGTDKVDFVGKKISELDPYIEQVHIKEKVDSDVLSSITAQHSPDLLIDEVDDLSSKAAIRAEAHRSMKPVIMATDLGDKSMIDVERHDQREVKAFNGRLKPKHIQALLEGADHDTRQKVLRRLIGILHITPRLLDSFMEQGKTLSGLPQLGSTATACSSLTTVTAREILLGRKMGSGRYIYSPKKTLKIQSPTPMTEGLGTLIRSIKASS